jgi:hypothetical protein
MTDVEARLRDTFATEGARLPVPEDPWPRFATREARHRRRRRARLGAAAALVGGLAAVQTNVFPLPGWMPGIAIAAPAASLVDAPARGAVAADAAWVDALRARVVGVEDPDGMWRVTDHDDVRVLWADDVPGRRLALVYTPLRLGLIESAELFLWTGPAGAGPDAMEQGSNVDAGTPVVSWMEVDAAAGGVAVVIAPPGATVRVGSGLRYAADGVVRPRATDTSTDGIAVVEVPPSAAPPRVTARVTDGGRVLYDGAVNGSWGSSGDAAPGPAYGPAVVGARGPALDPALFTAFATDALRDSGLTAADAEVRVRWTGRVNGQDAVLVTIHPTGGGVLAYAYHGSPAAYRTDLRLLLPAAGADERPIAWRLRAEGADGRTDRVVVIAPPGAQTLTVTPHGGTPTAVTVDGDGFGTTTLGPDRAAVVTSTDPRGHAVSTPVPPFDSDMGGPPGTTPGTRVVG